MTAMPFLRRWPEIKGVLDPALTFIPSLVFGFLFCMIFSLMMHQNPLDLIVALWEGAWGGRDEAITSLSKVTPLLLTGLAVSLAYQVGLLNIGCEGQLTLGALAAAGLAANAASLPPLLLAPLTVGVGALVGGLWAFPAAWLRQKRGVHEVITTLLLNYIAVYLADYLVRGPLGDGTAMARTAEIPRAMIWPFLWESDTMGLTAAPLLALFMCFLAQIWLSQTLWGYEVTVTGSNARAARNAGILVERWQRRLFVLSGALAGLAGALEVVTVHHRFYASFSPGYGFDGITIAFLVNACPGWLWLSALLLAGLRSADKWLQLVLNISPNAVFVIEAVLLLVVACQSGLRKRWDDLIFHVKRIFKNRETAMKNDKGS